MSARDSQVVSQLGLASNQVIFCRDCIVMNLLAVDGDFEKMVKPNPAITYQVYLEQNMPVALPVCLGHVTWKSKSIFGG